MCRWKGRRLEEPARTDLYRRHGGQNACEGCEEKKEKVVLYSTRETKPKVKEKPTLSDTSPRHSLRVSLNYSSNRDATRRMFRFPLFTCKHDKNNNAENGVKENDKNMKKWLRCGGDV